MFIDCGESTLGVGGISLEIKSNPAVEDAIAVFFHDHEWLRSDTQITTSFFQVKFQKFERRPGNLKRFYGFLKLLPRTNSALLFF